MTTQLSCRLRKFSSFVVRSVLMSGSRSVLFAANLTAWPSRCTSGSIACEFMVDCQWWFSHGCCWRSA